ncbi:MAG: hypothetical protein EXS60_01550 [Candidatus Pacebacteria bacterium]|nr:hypothetical protein [Candidatus Paceibacterota bacterium]
MRFLPHPPHFLQLGGFRKVKGNNFAAFYQTTPKRSVTYVYKKARGSHEVGNKERNHNKGRYPQNDIQFIAKK